MTEEQHHKELVQLLVKVYARLPDDRKRKMTQQLKELRRRQDAAAA